MTLAQHQNTIGLTSSIGCMVMLAKHWFDVLTVCWYQLRANTRCWPDVFFNVAPPSTKLAQHWNSIGSLSLCWLWCLVWDSDDLYKIRGVRVTSWFVPALREPTPSPPPPPGDLFYWQQQPSQCGDRLYTSQSDVYWRQIVRIQTVSALKQTNFSGRRPIT